MPTYYDDDYNEVEFDEFTPEEYEQAVYNEAMALLEQEDQNTDAEFEDNVEYLRQVFDYVEQENDAPLTPTLRSEILNDYLADPENYEVNADRYALDLSDDETRVQALADEIHDGGEED